MKKLLGLISGLLIALFSLSGCSVYYTYSEAERYASGACEITEKIDHVSVQWLQGEVEILPAAEGETSLKIQESSNLVLTESTSVHYLLEGTTLKIRYAQAGNMLAMLKKTLKVYIPNDLMSLDIDVSASNVRIGAIATGDCTVSVGNANTRLDGVRITRHFSFEAGKGSISGYADCTGADMELDVASGSIDLSPKACRSFDVIVPHGNSTLSFEETPTNGRFDVASGDITVYLPASAEFSLTMQKLVGKFITDFDYVKSGSYYVVGTGSNRFDVRVGSGDVKVYKK